MRRQSLCNACADWVMSASLWRLARSFVYCVRARRGWGEGNSSSSSSSGGGSSGGGGDGGGGSFISKYV